MHKIPRTMVWASPAGMSTSFRLFILLHTDPGKTVQVRGRLSKYDVKMLKGLFTDYSYYYKFMYKSVTRTARWTPWENFEEKGWVQMGVKSEDWRLMKRKVGRGVVSQT